jgi:hypothetical protein
MHMMFIAWRWLRANVCVYTLPSFHIFACHTERYHHYTEWAWHFAARGRVLAGNEVSRDMLQCAF